MNYTGYRTGDGETSFANAVFLLISVSKLRIEFETSIVQDAFRFSQLLKQEHHEYLDLFKE